MAFRYTGPNGAAGAVTYYVDDVTWGVVTEGIENTEYRVQTQKVLRDGQIVIRRETKEFTVLGIPMQ